MKDWAVSQCIWRFVRFSSFCICKFRIPVVIILDQRLQSFSDLLPTLRANILLDLDTGSSRNMQAYHLEDSQRGSGGIRGR